MRKPGAVAGLSGENEGLKRSGTAGAAPRICSFGRDSLELHLLGIVEGGFIAGEEIR
jgi:hypothetical protein